MNVTVYMADAQSTLLKCFGKPLFFQTIPNPPCPRVSHVAGGSDSTRFEKKMIHSASTTQSSNIPMSCKRYKSYPLGLAQSRAPWTRIFTRLPKNQKFLAVSEFAP